VVGRDFDHAKDDASRVSQHHPVVLPADVARPGSNKSLALGDAIICVNIKMHAGNVIAYPLEKQPLATGTVKGAVLGVFLASSSARPDGNFPKGRGGLAPAVRHI